MMDKSAFRLWAVTVTVGYVMDAAGRYFTPTSAWYEIAVGMAVTFFAILFAVSAWRRA